MKLFKYVLVCFSVISAVSCSNALNDANRTAAVSYSELSAPDLSVSDSRITATWIPLPNVISYRVYYSTSDSLSNALEFIGNSAITGTSCTISGLTNNITYYIWVQAQYASGSVFSPPSTATPAVSVIAPAASTIISVLPGDTQVKIQWNAVSEADSYEVYTSTLDDSSTASKFTGDADSTDTACTITGLTNGTLYYFWVKAVNSIGKSPFSASASGTPAAPAAAPSAPGVPLVIIGDSQITIQWAAVTGAASYEIYSSTSDDSSTAAKFAGDADSTDTACTITGLTNGTLYYIWIKAVNSIGSSPFNNSASGTPAAATAAPSAPGTPAVTAGYSKLLINWSAAANATSYEVYSSTTNDSSTAAKFTGDTDSTDLTCTVTGLTNGTVYYIWIKAVNAIGSSPFSVSASGTPSAAYAPGMLDTTFTSSAQAGYTIYSSAVQSDGKILIGGAFSKYNGTTCKGIARLNTDGTLDTSFDSSNGADAGTSTAAIYSIAVQSDGKILIGGFFKTYGGITQNGITRLDAKGSYDTSFNLSGTGITSGGTVRAISVLSSGKILIGGSSFTTYNGAGASHFACLNSDGTLDSSFNTSTGTDSSIYAIAVQFDGKIFIGGAFSSYNGTTIYRLACINKDGTLYTAFNPGTVNGSIYSIKNVSDEKIIVGGTLTTYNETAIGHLAQIYTSDGSLDASFNTIINPGASYTTSSLCTINAIDIQTDGKILIGGIFSSFNGTSQTRLARLNSNGSLDSFPVGTGPDSAVNTIAIQTDGNILIGGGFTSYNGTSQKYITRVFGN